MKVLYLIGGGDNGGAKRHVLSLLQELNTEETAQLVTLGDGPLAREAKEQGLAGSVLSGALAEQLRGVARKLRETECDVLHCHGSRANLIGALLKGRIGIPVITTIHSDHRLDYLGRPWARLSYGTLNALSLRRMDALICVSDAMRERYARRGFSREKLYTIYNGVDFTAPLRPGDRAAWYAEKGFTVTDTDIIVGTAARLDPVKDLSTLLRGFTGAAKLCPQLRLALAGDGAEAEKLRALARELGAADKVFFLGWLDDTEALYANMDICALTSRSETFPYALTDAARYALPAVSTPAGGVPALITDGETGLLIPFGDAAALAQVLVRLCRDANLRTGLGTALRARGEREFSLTAMGEKQKNIYRAICRPAGAS